MFTIITPRAIRQAATFVFALASLAACDSSTLATAPDGPTAAPVASVNTSASGNIIDRQHRTLQASFTLFAPCANQGQGDILGMRGTLEYRGHYISTSDGQRQHNSTVSNFTGIATGENGDVYDVTQREVSQSNTDYGTDGIQDSAEELQRIRVHLVHRITGEDIAIVLTGRFVQAGNGEYILSGWDGTARCR